MHYVHQQLVKERQDELARTAGQPRPSQSRPGQSTGRPSMRQNAGWLLVHVGLRLALGREARSAAARPA